MALPLVADERDWANCERVTDAHILVCGSEREEFHSVERQLGDALHTRGPARVEALRTLACAAPEDTTRLGNAVTYVLYNAAKKVGSEGGDDALIALVESGEECLIIGVSSALLYRRSPSPEAWARISRAAADRNVEPNARCEALKLVADRDNALIRSVAADISDPAQHCAAEYVVETLTPEARRTFVANSASPLHAEAVMAALLKHEGAPVTELCRIVRDPRRPREVRLDALFCIPDADTPETIACLESLLDPATWVSVGEWSTLNVIVARYQETNHERARAIGNSPLVSLLTPEQQDDIAARIANLTDQ